MQHVRRIRADQMNLIPSVLSPYPHNRKTTNLVCIRLLLDENFIRQVTGVGDMSVKDDYANI